MRLWLGVKYYPRVFGEVCELHTLGLLLHKELGDEVSGSRRNYRRETKVDAADASVRSSVSLCLERWTPDEEFVS